MLKTPPGRTAIARRSLFAAHPARTVVVAFAAVIAAGTVLLALLIAAEDRTATGAVPALFTSTSAVCLTGLAVVDTGSH